MLYYWLLKELTDYGPRTAIELTVKVPFDFMTVKYQLREMVNEGKIAEQNGYYSIKA